MTEEPKRENILKNMMYNMKLEQAQRKIVELQTLLTYLGFQNMIAVGDCLVGVDSFLTTVFDKITGKSRAM